MKLNDDTSIEAPYGSILSQFVDLGEREIPEEIQPAVEQRLRELDEQIANLLWEIEHPEYLR